MQDYQEHLPRRVILLGASNLTRGISTVIDTARQTWGEPLEILAALGHGRSYGQNSSVLIRRLPGITECGLWEALAARPPANTAALIADIGNDILYGVPVERVIDWIRHVMGELDRVSSRIVLILPPLCNLHVITTWRFHALMKVLVPHYDLAPGVLSERARELDHGLRELAAPRNVTLIEPRPEWYGFDPIHVRLSQCDAVWNEVMGKWKVRENEAETRRKSSWNHWLQLRSTLPERCWIAGTEYRTPQPARRFANGSTLALY
jgi:hypothetical protein